MSIYASEFLKWLRIFGVTTGGGPAPTGALLAVNNLDDVLNSTTSIENIGLGRPGILVLTDADFAGGGGTYVLTNPPPIYVSMSATSPGRVLQLPPQNQATSLQGSEAIRIITGGAQEININNGAGTLIFQAAADSAWDAIPNNRTTIAGAWEFLGVVMTINGNKTGNVLLTSDPHTLYVSNSGSDLGGDGSQLFPYATLSHALAVATPSPTSPYEIVMLRGIYTETNVTLKANVYINGTYSTLNVSGTISLDVDWASGGYLYIQNFENLILPSVVNLDFNAVFAPFALFSFANNIINSNTTMNVTGGTANGAIVLISNNFGFSNEISYNITNCYGAINGGACGDIHVINTSDTAGGNFSVVGMTEIGNFTATTSSTSGLTVFHEASKVIGDTLYQTTGPGNLIAQEKGITHLGGLTLDNGLGGGIVQFSAANLTALPTLLNGATYQPDSISDAMRANKYYTPSNYTPLPGPPGEWVADSVTGNLAGIDAALASGGSIPPAYAETYFQDNAMPTTFTGANTPTKVLATAYNTGEIDGFTQVNGTFTYTGLPTRIIQLTAMLTATYAGTVQNTSFFITKNGTPIAKSKQKALIGIVTPAPEPLPVQVTTSAITGDLFELWVENNDNTNAITVIDLNFGIQGITGNATSAGIPPSYAEMFFQDNATPTVIAGSNIPVKINATYSADMLKDFTHANGTLTYNNALAKVFVVDADLTATYPGTAQNTSFFITKNGSVIAKSKQSTFIGPISPANVANPCHAVIGLSLGDTIEVWVENNDNANDVIVTDFNLFINSIDATGTSPNIAQIAQLIWANNLDGNDTNNGSIDSPLKTYEAARLLAISRGASSVLPFGIIPVGIFNITGNLTISPYINILGQSPSQSVFNLTGGIVNDTAWYTLNNTIVSVQDCRFIAPSGLSAVFNGGNGNVINYDNCDFSQTATLFVSTSNTSAVGNTVSIQNNIIFGLASFTSGTTILDSTVYLVGASLGNVNITATGSGDSAGCVLSIVEGELYGTVNVDSSGGTGGFAVLFANAAEVYATVNLIGANTAYGADAASYYTVPNFSSGASIANVQISSLADSIVQTTFTPAHYTPTGDTTFLANSLTANLKGIDLALPTAGGSANTQFIYIDQLNGNDVNDGTINRPMQNYEAARLEAISRFGVSLTLVGVLIIVVGNQNITGDMTLTPGISIDSQASPYTSGFEVSGNVILDPTWGTNFSYVQVRNVYIYLSGGNYNFIFPAIDPTGSSFLKFVNCAFNTGGFITITGAGGVGVENVTFENCTVDFLNYTPGFTAENVNLYLINTDLTVSDITMTVSSALGHTYVLAINDARFYTGNISVITSSTDTLTTYINACNTMSKTLTVNGTLNTVIVDSTSYMFTLALAGGATLANLNLPTKTDGMTNASYTPLNYTPAADTAFKANSLTGNLKGIDNKLGNIKAGSATVGGTGAGPYTISVPGLTTSSIAVASVQQQVGIASFIVEAQRGTGQINVLFNLDPGAGTIVDYVAFIAPQ